MSTCVVVQILQGAKSRLGIVLYGRLQALGVYTRSVCVPLPRWVGDGGQAAGTATKRGITALQTRASDVSMDREMVSQSRLRCATVQARGRN